LCSDIRAVQVARHIDATRVEWSEYVRQIPTNDGRESVIARAELMRAVFLGPTDERLVINVQVLTVVPSGRLNVQNGIALILASCVVGVDCGVFLAENVKSFVSTEAGGTVGQNGWEKLFKQVVSLESRSKGTVSMFP
jgi:hypothetical protein